MLKKLAVWCTLVTLLLLAAAPVSAAPFFKTTVSLKLAGSLVATGRVRSGAHRCVIHRTVLIQERGDGGGWRTVGNSQSRPNGTYRIEVPNQTGSFRAFVKKTQLDGGEGTCRPGISKVVTIGDGPLCTTGYSPCLVWHGGADYDCYGGSGNGPYYTAPGVTYRVTGPDIYGLDADHDGYGCE
jgi:hypothetical protein